MPTIRFDRPTFTSPSWMPYAPPQHAGGRAVQARLDELQAVVRLRPGTRHGFRAELDTTSTYIHVLVIFYYVGDPSNSSIEEDP